VERINNSECLCDKCPKRFLCYTTERIFSDARYQAIYEAEIALGKTKEQAVKTVMDMIEAYKIPIVSEEQKWWGNEWLDLDKKYEFKKEGKYKYRFKW
jgi:hypothetical protein